jgi:hypothetical protein
MVGRKLDTEAQATPYESAMPAKNHVSQPARGARVDRHEKASGSSWADAAARSRATARSRAWKYRDVSTERGSRMKATMARKTVILPSMMKRYCQF